MARGRAYRFQRFARGLNTADGVYGLRDGYRDDPGGRGSEARDLLNVISRSRGNVRKRPGSTTFSTVTGLKDLTAVNSDSSGAMIGSTVGGNLIAFDTAGAQTLLASGTSPTARWTWLHLPTVDGQGPYFGMNGTDSPRWVGLGFGTGTWTASSGSVPNGFSMVYAGNRVWVTDGQSVYFSEIGDPRTWPAENVTRFEPGDGQPITALGVVGPYVLVFKERAIYAIYDLDTSANRKITDQAGTLSPKSVVSTERGTLFLDAERGVMSTDGSHAVRISEQIQPTWDRISGPDKSTVSAAWWRNHYYVAARFDASSYYVVDYDSELDSWWLHSHQARALTVLDRGAGAELYAAHPGTVARLMVPGATTDEGVAFRSFWAGPFHDFSSPHLNKRCRRIQLDGRGTVNVSVLSDFYAGLGTAEEAVFPSDGDTYGDTGTFGGAGTFGGGLLIGEDELLALGIGRVWAIAIGNETDVDWELDSYVMLMETRAD